MLSYLKAHLTLSEIEQKSFISQFTISQINIRSSFDFYFDLHPYL